MKPLTCWEIRPGYKVPWYLKCEDDWRRSLRTRFNVTLETQSRFPPAHFTRQNAGPQAAPQAVEEGLGKSEVNPTSWHTLYALSLRDTSAHKTLNPMTSFVSTGPCHVSGLAGFPENFQNPG
jgi:hypothetical protein